MSDDVTAITDEDHGNASDEAWKLAELIVEGNQGTGNAAVLIDRHCQSAVAEALVGVLADDSEMLTIAWMDGSHRSTKAHRETIAGLRDAISLYELALTMAFPDGASGDTFVHWNEARARAAMGAKP